MIHRVREAIFNKLLELIVQYDIGKVVINAWGRVVQKSASEAMTVPSVRFQLLG